MVTIFIDESGNLGKKDRFFVIAALVPNNSKRIYRFIKRFAKANQLNEVKGSRITFPQKQSLLQELTTQNDSSISYIVVDKLHINNKKLREDKNLCYNYASSFLLEALIKGIGEDIVVLLDNHSTRVGSINSFSDYIKIKAFTEWNFQNNLSVSYVDSRNSKIIQCVDVAANAIWARYNYNTAHLYGMLPIKHSIKFPAAKFGQ